MTSRLLRSRRITAWSTAIAISLGGAAFGQTGTPAPTTWQPYTPPVAVPANNLPPAIPPVQPKPVEPAKVDPRLQNLPPLPELPPPPKFLNYQKPANESKPREAVQQYALPPRTQGVPTMQRPPAQPLPVETVSTPQAPLVARPAAMLRPQPKTDPNAPRASDTAIPQDAPLPNRQDLFRIVNDKTLDERITAELTKLKKITDKDAFPPMMPMVPPGTVYEPKTLSYAPTQLLRQPTYVIHRRLYFEQLNSERGMWDAGPAQSVFSAALFYRDVLCFPMKVASACRGPYDTNVGKCMPGTPTPLYIYPPSDVTLFGGAVGVAVITGAAIIFP